MDGSPKSRAPDAGICDAVVPDVAGLRRFARATDRSKPPFFSGRSEEIEETRERLKDCVRDWRKGKKGIWEGRTTLFQGAPGAGKTALLRNLAETLPNEIEGLRVCKLESEDLDKPVHWQERLGEALVEGAGRRLKMTLLLEAGVDAKVVTGGAGVVGPLLTWGDILEKAKEGVPSAQAPSAQASRTDARGAGKTEKGGIAKTARKAGAKVADALGGLGPLRPVLLLIDEVQNALGKPAAAFLSAMHKSTYDLPIFPVYGGLAWSSRRLKSLGLSRTSLGYVRTLDPLSESECREAVEGFFVKFRARGSRALMRRWADQIAVECQGWPQHLNAHLQALAGELGRGEIGGNLDILEEAGLAPEVSKEAAGKRESYYADRLDHEDLGGRSFLAAESALRIGPGKETIARLGREIQKVSDERGEEDPDMELPKGMSGEDFANAMVRSGILHKGPKDILSVPIPSFIGYLEREYGLATGRSPRSGRRERRDASGRFSAP